MQRLSFLYHPMEHVFSRIPGIARQCRSFICVWENQKGKLEFKSHYNGNSDRGLISDKRTGDNISGYMSSSARSHWIHPDEDPFDASTSGGVQLDIGREEDRNILILVFPGIKGLIILRFDKFINQFGITGKNRPLNNEDRTILSAVLVQSFDTIIDIHQSDRKVFSPLSNMKSHLQSEIQVLQRDLEMKDRNLSRGLEEYTDHILSKLAEANGIEIKLSKRAYEKIADFDGKFTELEASLEESLSIAMNSSLELANEIILDESDLFLRKISPVTTSSSQEDSPSVGRLTRTHQLLDKYEESAMQARRNGEPIIGRVVGAYCEPPISNAAITDSLNNHSDRIWELMMKYPSKWPLIRSEFRSVINLISRQKQKRQAELEEKVS